MTATFAVDAEVLPEFAAAAQAAIDCLGLSFEQQVEGLTRLGVRGIPEDPCGCVWFTYLTEHAGLPVAEVQPGHDKVVKGVRSVVRGRVLFSMFPTLTGQHLPQELVLSVASSRLAQQFDLGNLPELVKR